MVCDICYRHDLHPTWAHKKALLLHGWKISECDGSWYKKYEKRKTEFLGGPYLPQYKRTIKKILKQNN